MRRQEAVPSIDGYIAQPLPAQWAAYDGGLLAMQLPAPIRDALSTWLARYGTANFLARMSSGSLDSRLDRAAQLTDGHLVLAWTTPMRWAAGQGVGVRMPRFGLEFVCSVTATAMHAIEMRPAPSADPLTERGSVGVVLRPDSITLGTSHERSAPNRTKLKERHIADRGVSHGTAVAEPLQAALAAEQAEETRRIADLTVRYGALTPGDCQRGWLLRIRPSEAVDEFDVGEPVEVSGNAGSQLCIAGHVLSTRPSSGVLEVQLPGAVDPAVTHVIR